MVDVTTREISRLMVLTTMTCRLDPRSQASYAKRSIRWKNFGLRQLMRMRTLAAPRELRSVWSQSRERINFTEHCMNTIVQHSLLRMIDLTSTRNLNMMGQTGPEN